MTGKRKLGLALAGILLLGGIALLAGRGWIAQRAFDRALDQNVGAKALVLYHLVPPVPARLIELLFLGDAGKIYSGPLKLAQDGMIVRLPADGGAAQFSSGF